MNSHESIIKGTIIGLTDNEVIVDVGLDFEGVISLSEFRNNSIPKVGDSLDVCCEGQRSDGHFVLTHKKVLLLKSWERVKSAFESGEIVKGYVKSRTKGGLIVEVFGLEAFLPGSQIDVKPIRDYDVLVDSVMEFKVVKMNQEFKNVVVSHKALIEDELEAQKTEIISKLEKGQILEGVVKNITSYGVFVDIGGIVGLIHITDLSWGNVQRPEDVVKLGEIIEVVILDFDGEKKRIALGFKQLAFRDFALKYQPGTIFEAEVVKIQKSIIRIRLGNLEGIVTKEETYWNEIDSLDDLLFIGETVNAVFLKYEKGQLYFSLKLLNEKPYDESLYDLNKVELLKFAGNDSRVFIGQAKQRPYGLFIENLYSDDKCLKGKLLVDPLYGYNICALVPNTNTTVFEGKYYRIKLSLVSKDLRLNRNQLFQFFATDIEETTNPYKADVDLTFAKSTSPRDCSALAHTLAEVGKNMYSSKDRMFFELVQNADDAAAQKGVYVNVRTHGDFLILRHNGYSFDKDDFDAITSSANGTKKANENKTGYKGIGFKSVFTDSEIVFINTGGYQFKFDRNDPRFSDFEEFYFFVNGYSTEQQKNDFLQKFSSERNKFKGVADIPWQLEPIWVDRFPEELGEDFTKSNVAIALKLGESKIIGENGYNKAIADIFDNPRFMLFLRNTKRIDFNGLSVSKTANDGIITLKNSFGTKRVDYFKREDFEIKVDNNVFEENGIDIRIVVDERDEFSGKVIEAKFVDTNNHHELENIPKKIAINNSTVVSFAVPIEENGSLKPNTKCNEVSLFAFLPTLVKDFKFPFYINGNFVLDPPRQRVLGDNPWNFYLMQEIAKSMVRWCASLNEKRDKNALNILITHYFEEDAPDTRQLAEHFNRSYKKALESEAFILNCKDELAKQEDIIIDDTGLAGFIGAELFCKLLCTDGCLPSTSIDCKILSNQFFQQVKHISTDIVHCKLINNEDLKDWYIHADQKSKDGFNKWIIKNDLRDVINTLPIFKFDDEWKTPSEIDDNENYIVLSTKFSHLKSILVKLGLCCSNVFDEDDLFQIDETKLFERIYKKIEGHNLIVKKLHQYKDICCGVGADDYYYINYYQSLLSEIKKGGFLSREHEQLLSQIKPDYFSASDFEMTESELDGLNEAIRDHFIFDDFPDAVSRIIVETALTPKEKLMLMKTDFWGIGEARIKEIELFYSIDNASFHNGGEPASLQHLLPYRVDAPGFVKPYMICEAENFPELQKYLVDSEKEFELVVMPHLTEILGSTFSLADIASQYKEGQQLRSLIETNDSNESLKQLLPFVESSDDKTKEFFLNKIVDIRLSDEQRYKKESFEYRVLKLALYVYADAPSVFSSKINYEGRCIKDFSLKDEVECAYYQEGKERKVTMSLARLLPKYQDQSDAIENVKTLFGGEKWIDKFFDAKPKPISEVYSELNNEVLHIVHATYSPWKTGNGNAIQYLFSVYRRKQSWSVVKGLQIDLRAESDAFINELMDFICDNNLQIETSPFTVHLRSYFKAKSFDSQFVLDEEKLLRSIEKWADNEKKKKYLTDNGVWTENSNAIKFRKLFLDNNTIDFLEQLEDDELSKGVGFISVFDGINRPFIGDNQKAILLQLKNKDCCNISVGWDVKKMEEDSMEWGSKEYLIWIEGHYPRIFIYPGLLPRQLLYKDELLLNYEDTEFNYYYDQQKQQLYVSNTRKIDVILFEAAKEAKSDFNLDDYRLLCMEGKVSISEEDIVKKNKTIETLSESNRKKDEIIEQYRAKYGDLEGDGTTGAIRGEVPSINVLHHNAQNEIDLQRGRVIERDGLSEEKQVAAHKEASEIIREKLEEEGYDCSNWIVDEDKDEFKKWHSVNQVDGIVSPAGDTINLVVKSAKGGYIYLSATDFEFLTSNSNNVLMVWDGDSVHSVSAEEIFNKDSNVNLIFDTEYTPKHYYAALSKVFQYVKRTTFAVKNPSYNAYNTIKSFGMDSTTEGVQELFDDNDL